MCLKSTLPEVIFVRVSVFVRLCVREYVRACVREYVCAGVYQRACERQ